MGVLEGAEKDETSKANKSAANERIEESGEIVKVSGSLVRITGLAQPQVISLSVPSLNFLLLLLLLLLPLLLLLLYVISRLVQSDIIVLGVYKML